MFDSIATLFSTPIIARTYQNKPSLQEHCKAKTINRYGRVQRSLDKQSEDIVQSLNKPIQMWIIQKQPYLRCTALNHALYAIIASHSNTNNEKKQQKILLVHNLFVLIVQYKLLNERIKEMSMNELQVFINGLCGIYLLEEKGPLDQLTCLLHFVITNTRMYECDNLKGNLCLFRLINSSRLNHFYSTYSKLRSAIKESFLDVVVNVIPMMTELSKIIVKTGQGSSKLFFLQKINWLGKIGLTMINTITKDIDAVVAGEQQINEQIANPSLRSRLFEKGRQLAEIEGIITNKVLFSFAYKELYFFQHTLKLHKYLMQIAFENESYKVEQQKNNLMLVNTLLKAVSSYQFNLPDTSIQSVGSILNVSICQHQENKICLPNLNHPQLQQFIEDLKCCHLYQVNFHADELQQQEQEQFEFCYDKDDSVVSSIIYMLFNLKLEYLQVLRIIMNKIDKKYLQNLQFYLIKNGLLHFLIEQLQSIQSNDKKTLQNYFKVIALLLHRNTVAYCILNQIIRQQIYQNEKSTLVQYIRKNFVHARPLIFVVLTDSISINSKKMSRHFLPLPLHHLLYNTMKNQTTTKHDIWVSYIHDVIIRELKGKRDKQKNKKGYYDDEINEWVMLAIIIQIEHTIFKKGSDIELGQFTMSYLTNMLKEAIKWNHHDQTEVMRNLLNTYQDWESHYHAIIAKQKGQDTIENRWGPTFSFEYLKKWNKKICNSIKIFIESVANCTNNDLF